MLYEIVYQSLAEKDFKLKELNELMVFSTAANVENGITGCLMYHNRTFIQVLEGDIEQVKALYAKIQNDNRHSKVETVWEGEIGERGFSGWSMSLMNLGDINISGLFSDFLDSDELSYDIKGIVTTSKALLRQMKDKL